MNDPDASKITRLSELPRNVPPPHDGWPALEARLRESASAPSDSGTASGTVRETVKVRRWRPQLTHFAALAAVLAAVVVGVSIDRWILSPARTASQSAPVARVDTRGGELNVAYINDPRYIRERAELLRSLDARLAKLPPPTRQKVLESLATIHQSMRNIQQALGREPGNALLQELLIDTYQDEMQVLSTVQEASGGSGET